MDSIFENFTVTVLKLNKLVHKIKQYEMQEYGLKAIHVMCGYYLHKHPQGLTSGELVKLTLEDKAAISRALKCLQEKGYVYYDPNKHNYLVRLTDEGKKLAEYIIDRSNKAVEAGTVLKTKEDTKFFYDSLESIARNLTVYYSELIKDNKNNG